jgi:hypothetical protein
MNLPLAEIEVRLGRIQAIFPEPRYGLKVLSPNSDGSPIRTILA